MDNIFIKEGQRGIAFACRDLNNQEKDDFLKEYKIIKEATPVRIDKLEELAKKIEINLKLLGLLAI